MKAQLWNILFFGFVVFLVVYALKGVAILFS